MKCSHEALAHYQFKLRALGQVATKTQFGGYSLSVDSVVFALVKNDAIFLRGSVEMTHYLAQHQLPPFIFEKRGNAICLNYYQVDHQLWHDDATLICLSRAALSEAQKCQSYKKSHRRIKDLPNLGIKFETLLREAGIHTEEQLRETGAIQSWILMHRYNNHLGLQTLFYLQGAILGVHYAVLSALIKQELTQWHRDYIKSRQQATFKKIMALRVGL